MHISQILKLFWELKNKLQNVDNISQNVIVSYVMFAYQAILILYI